MSMGFGGWRYSGPRAHRACPEAVAYHDGDRHDFLRRCHKAIAKAVQQGRQGLREMAPYVLKWATDPRNFRVAWSHCAGGGESPGPSGRRYEDYEEHDIWNLARVMQRAVLQGTYHPGPERIVPIYKTLKRGRRKLALQDIEDRAMARAFQQVLEPLLDPFFDNYVFGSRPGRNREQALALAEHLAIQEGRHVWVVADIRDAFDNVSTGRLLDVLRKWLPDEALISALANIIQRQDRRGIRQGSPLSPLLLDVYLSHFLDRKWRKRFPHIPLLRAVDDMLVLCGSKREADEIWSGLKEFLTPAGMPLKGTPGQAIRDLAKGQTALWLGYALQLGKDGLEARIAKKAWKRLEENLVRAHAQAGTPLKANMAISGWISQLGPCYTDEDRSQVIARVTSMAQEWALDEIPGSHDLQGWWQRAHARWCRLRKRIVDSAGGTRGGFARHVDFSAQPRRSDGAPSGAPSLPFPSSEEVVLHTDGCCLNRSRVGGWAYVLHSNSRLRQSAGRGGLRRTTSNRAELIAAIKGLKRLAPGATVVLVTDSQYVADGINKWLSPWRARGWRAGSGRHRRPLKNLDLWRRLDELLSRLHVTCRHVPGHAGHPENEMCDNLAREEAIRQEHLLTAQHRNKITD